jgi:TonB family protein
MNKYLIFIFVLTIQNVYAQNIKPCTANDAAIEFINFEMPIYPTSPYTGSFEGYVTLSIHVNEEGHAVVVKVIDSNPRRKFDNSAIKAIKNSKFSKSKDKKLRCGIHTIVYNLSRNQDN